MKIWSQIVEGSGKMKLGNGRFLRITEIYAFISKDKDGHEGVMGFQTPNGVMMPMIGADVEMVDKLKPQADKIKKITGMDYEIRFFHR